MIDEREVEQASEQLDAIVDAMDEEWVEQAAPAMNVSRAALRLVGESRLARGDSPEEAICFVHGFMFGIYAGRAERANAEAPP